MAKRQKLGVVEQYQLEEVAKELYFNRELDRWPEPSPGDAKEFMRLAWSYARLTRSAVHVWGCVARHRLGLGRHLTRFIAVHILTRPGWWTPGSFYHDVYEVICERTLGSDVDCGALVGDIYAGMLERRPDATDGQIHIDGAIQMLEIEGHIYWWGGHWKAAARID